MIGLGCDHGGLELKKTVMEYLDSKGIEYKDFGTYTSDSCDYPVYGKAVAHAVADGYHVGLFFQYLQEEINNY
mgnify:CR=1 FL=1